MSERGVLLDACLIERRCKDSRRRHAQGMLRLLFNIVFPVRLFRHCVHRPVVSTRHRVSIERENRLDIPVEHGEQ